MSAEITKARLLEWLDDLLHRKLDGYINAQRLGWGGLQLAQWYVCNAFERAADALDGRS